MDDIIRRLSELWAPNWKGPISVIDILIVAFLVYRLMMMVRGTRAWKILIGIGVFVLALYLSEILQLRTLHWLLEKATLLAPVALVILLLPELRQAIEGFAKLGLWPEKFLGSEYGPNEATVDAILAAAATMSEQKIGALIVIERTEQLNDVIKTGVPLNAKVSSALLEAVFYDGNPLHDGAAVIRKDQLVSAACRLPLSEDATISSQYHMRHRAGLGISENSDAAAVIVSEERGEIAVAIGGQIQAYTSLDELRIALNRLMVGEPGISGGRLGVFRRKKNDEEIKNAG